jgi:hypothetical protein
VRLYHFLPAEYVLDDLAKGRLKIDKLKDPFELFCLDQRPLQRGGGWGGGGRSQLR